MLNQILDKFSKRHDRIPVNLYGKRFFNWFFLNILEKKFKLNATEGPIPNANSKVPIPTIPPKNHPSKTTTISKQALT